MKLTRKLCEQAGIINDYDYSLKNTQPYLTYHRQELGRAYRSASWNIQLKGKKYSDFWRDWGAMVFPVYRREEKQEKFQQAVEWMKQEYGFVEIIKTPLGAYMEKGFVERRNQEIINALKQGISLRER